MVDVPKKSEAAPNPETEEAWRQVSLQVNSPQSNKLSSPKREGTGGAGSHPKGRESIPLDIRPELSKPKTHHPVAKTDHHDRSHVPLPQPKPKFLNEGRQGQEPPERGGGGHGSDRFGRTGPGPQNPLADAQHLSFDERFNFDKPGPAREDPSLLKRFKPLEPSVYPVELSKFADTAKKLLAKIADYGDSVSKDGLERALENPDIKGQDAQVLAALYRDFDRLVQPFPTYLSEFPPPAMLAPSDLDRFDTMQKSKQQEESSMWTTNGWAEKNLDRFATGGADENGVKRLTEGDITQALKRTDLSTLDKDSLQFLQDHFEKIAAGKRDLSAADVTKFATNFYKSSPDTVLVNDIRAAIGDVNASQKPGVNHDLYANKDDPSQSITPDAILQGGTLGDCYFGASLAEVASTHPDFIKDAIKDNHDGTYTVTFRGAPDTPVTVKAPTETELGLYNHGSPYGVWASVMEKAYGQLSYINDHWWITREFDKFAGRWAAPEAYVHDGGYSSETLDLLTGGTHLDLPPDSLQQLTKAFSGPTAKSVVAQTGLLDPPSPTTQDGFLTTHAFSVLGFRPDNEGGGFVTVRSPHGHGENNHDGTITITFEEFKRNFSRIWIEK